LSLGFTNSHRAALGAQVATVTGPDGAPGGTGIVAVTDGGPADQAGLRPGDVIGSVGPAPTPDASALSQALAAGRPGEQVTVDVTRGTQGMIRELTVRVTLGELPGS
jgi:putative serine protease PepD